MSHVSQLKFEATVIYGKLVIKDPTIDLPDGSVVHLVVGKVVSKQCRYTWVPGILNDPMHPTPRVRTRCKLEDGHEGDHDIGFVPRPDTAYDDEDFTI